MVKIIDLGENPTLWVAGGRCMSASRGPRWSLHLVGHGYAIADRKDRREKALVRCDRFVHLLDRCRPFGPGVLFGEAFDHTAGPQRVIADEEAPDADAF